MKVFCRGLCALFVLLVTAGGCNVIDKLRGKKDDDNAFALVFLAAVLGQNTGCQNQSGLVICIPPGLRQ